MTYTKQKQTHKIRTHKKIQTNKIQTGQFKSYYRVWGTGPIKVLFFHGGPGQAVVDYGDSNFDIFRDSEKYTVLEPDQLGTGSSEPSIRETMQHTNTYENVTPQDIARALSQILDHLGWKQIYLHGGSWGSTLALIFAQMFPERVIGMVLRGIYLGTPDEYPAYHMVNEPQTDNIREARKKLTEFIIHKGFVGDPNNSELVLKFFLKIFLSAPLEERDLAALNWWVYERYIMDECEPGFYSEFSQISHLHKDLLGEARSVAFWEVSLIHKMAFGTERYDILKNIQKIPKVPIEIVHGSVDFLCPSKYANMLEQSLKEHGYQVTANYVGDGHKIVGPLVKAGVREAVERFAAKYMENKLGRDTVSP